MKKNVILYLDEKLGKGEQLYEYTSKGWTVASVTAQHVSSGGNGYYDHGGFLVVLEKIESDTLPVGQVGSLPKG